jgi:Zn-dependent membrane protease YugP
VIFDPLYLLMIAPAMILSLWAQWKVKHNYKKYAAVPSSSGLTGAQVAKAILSGNGLHAVRIEEVQGVLTDHYDPASRVLRLSPGVYGGRSVSAAGIAAHECGHALQHAAAYGPLALRQTLAPAAIWGSKLSWIFIMVGMVVHSLASLTWVGIGLFSLAVAFSLITLPVEFDASRRAKKILPTLGLVSASDRDGVAAVLNAAAMTYVAAAAAAILTLVYFLLRANGSRN